MRNANGAGPFSRFERIFVLDDNEPRGPNVRPKDAAVLVLYRRESGRFRILMGQRSNRHVFMPGRFVFPGGRIEPSDLRLAARTNLRDAVLAKAATGITEARARGLALAAIRETYEETGLLVGSRGGPPLSTRSPAWRHYLSHGVLPRLEGLDFIARAITPPGRPRRFDARFFMAGEEEIANGFEVSKTDGELKSLQWLSFEEARAADIIPITRCIIDEIEARLRDGARAHRPVPFFVPYRGRAIVKEL